MLIKAYSKSLVRPPNPSAPHLRCFAAVEADLTEVLPYLNTALKAYEYSPEPPSLTLKLPGKLVTIHPREIAINIVKDEDEADDILEWLKKEINATWERRGEIEPGFEKAARPRVFDLLKLLPRTNCGRCGEPTCMVFAVQVGQGEKTAAHCPELTREGQEKLQEYLGGFRF
jgi:ArsR family metal-binding transcriptional regulator